MRAALHRRPPTQGRCGRALQNQRLLHLNTDAAAAPDRGALYAEFWRVEVRQAGERAALAW